MAEQKTKLSKKINDILGYISIVVLAIALLSYSYDAGKESKRIDVVETRLDKGEEADKKLKQGLDEQFKIIQSADARLGLLLDYFHITDSTRHD